MAMEAFLINPHRKRRAVRRARRSGGLPGLFIRRARKSGAKNVLKKAWSLFKARKHVSRKRGRRNPAGELMILNPRRRHAKAVKINMARRKAHRKTRRLTIHGGRISRTPRIARRMRGSIINPIGGLSMFNPRFRMRSHRRRSYRRNPAMLGGIIPKVSTITNALKDSFVATGGYVGVKLIPNYLLPANFRTGTLGYVGKVGTAIVLSMLAGKFIGKEQGKIVLLGGLMAVTTEVAGQLLLKVGGTLQDSMALGAYVPELSAYIPQE